jgi:hypothetical protein
MSSNQYPDFQVPAPHSLLRQFITNQGSRCWFKNHIPPPLEDDIYPLPAIRQNLLFTHPFWLYFCPFSIYFTLLTSISPFSSDFSNFSFTFLIFLFLFYGRFRVRRAFLILLVPYLGVTAEIEPAT